MDPEEKVLAGLMAIAFVVFAFCATFVRAGSPGSAYSVGTVVNTASEGALFGRPVIYLLHAGEMKAERMGATPDVARLAESYMAEGTRVRVHYTEYLLCWTWNYASCQVADSIEPDKVRQ